MSQQLGLFGLAFSPPPPKVKRTKAEAATEDDAALPPPPPKRRRTSNSSRGEGEGEPEDAAASVAKAAGGSVADAGTGGGSVSDAGAIGGNSADAGTGGENVTGVASVGADTVPTEVASTALDTDTEVGPTTDAEGALTGSDLEIWSSLLEPSSESVTARSSTDVSATDVSPICKVFTGGGELDPSWPRALPSVPCLDRHHGERAPVDEQEPPIVALQNLQQQVLATQHLARRLADRGL